MAPTQTTGTESLLARAASPSSLEILNLLLEHGAEIEGSQALNCAAESGRMDAATVLLARGADINEVFRHNLWDNDAKYTIGTALHVAVQTHQQDFVQFLLQQGARIDLAAGEGTTPRHLHGQLAQAQGKTAILELFDGVNE